MIIIPLSCFTFHGIRKMAITDWPVDDRPREKLLSKGAAALSDAELVAIFLRTGVTGKSAVDLARDVVAQFGSLSALCGADRKTFCNIHGLGEAKYVQLQAVLEMAQRALGEKLKQGVALNSPKAVRDYLRLRLHNRPHEVFVGVFLDAQHRVLAVDDLFSGTLTQTSVYPREVVKRALHHNAAAVIFAQNVNSILKSLISLAARFANAGRWGQSWGQDRAVEPASAYNHANAPAL